MAPEKCVSYIQLTGNGDISLRSKRFQSSCCAKVGAETLATQAMEICVFRLLLSYKDFNLKVAAGQK